MATAFRISLSADEEEELNGLLVESKCEDMKDLLNNALTLFSWAAKEVGKGRSIASVDEKTGKFTILSMDAFDNLKRKTN